MATNSYQRMSDRVFNMNWPELSVKLQKYAIVMIENMQKPIYYFAGGIVILDLNTFINVGLELNQILNEYFMEFNIFVAIFQLIRRVINYYMIFKRITSI